MAETIAGTLLVAAATYAVLGLGFALAFAARGVNRIDAAARTGTLGFRIAIVPGAAAFWPFLLRRWRRAEAPR